MAVDLKRKILAASALGIALGAAACAREQARVVENPRAPRDEDRDFRAVLERVRNRQRPIEIQQALENAIRHFQRDMARLPTNLNELVQRHYLRELKPAPAGHAYSYDPVYGNVAVVPVSPEGLVSYNLAPTNGTRIQMDEPALPPPP